MISSSESVVFVQMNASQSLRFALFRTQTILAGIRFSLPSITSADFKAALLSGCRFRIIFLMFYFIIIFLFYYLK